MITTTWTCDLCGGEVFGPHYAVLVIGGRGIALDTGKTMKLDEQRHYHAGAVDSCYSKIMDALNLTEDVAPTLESIPTITGQALGARRRKHRKVDE